MILVHNLADFCLPPHILQGHYLHFYFTSISMPIILSCSNLTNERLRRSNNLPMGIQGRLTDSCDEAAGWPSVWSIFPNPALESLRVKNGKVGTTEHHSALLKLKHKVWIPRQTKVSAYLSPKLLIYQNDKVMFFCFYFSWEQNPNEILISSIS